MYSAGIVSASAELVLHFFFLMIPRPPRSTRSRSSAASDVYKRQPHGRAVGCAYGAAVKRQNQGTSRWARPATICCASRSLHRCLSHEPLHFLRGLHLSYQPRNPRLCAPPVSLPTAWRILHARAITRENPPRSMRTYKSCRFANFVSYRPPTCGDPCLLRRVSRVSSQIRVISSAVPGEPPRGRAASSACYRKSLNGFRRALTTFGKARVRAPDSKSL